MKPAARIHDQRTDLSQVDFGRFLGNEGFKCFMKRALVMALISIFMTTAALSQSRSLQQETIACQDDALRLCGPYIPDHAKIHSCLLTHKAYISPACRAIVAPPHHRHHHKAH
jgi:hypothetical protein